MEGLRSVLTVNQLFGLNAFTYRQTSFEVIFNWSRTGVALVVFHVVLNLFFSIQNAVLPPEKYGDSGSYLLDGGGQLTLGFSYFSMLATVFMRLARQDLMVKILNHFRVIDQRMAENRMLLDHRREARLVLNYIWIIVGVIGMAALGGLYMFYLMGTIGTRTLFYSGKVYVSYQGLLLAHSGFVMNQLLVRRIQLLNHRLR